MKTFHRLPFKRKFNQLIFRNKIGKLGSLTVFLTKVAKKFLNFLLCLSIFFFCFQTGAMYFAYAVRYMINFRQHVMEASDFQTNPNADKHRLKIAEVKTILSFCQAKSLTIYRLMAKNNFFFIKITFLPILLKNFFFPRQTQRTFGSRSSH